MAIAKINLFNFNRPDLTTFFCQIGEKPFRAEQIIKWIHQCGMLDFSLMTNLSLSLRNYLKENTEIKLPLIATRKTSYDGTQKWLLQLEDDNCIETVFIPEKDRGTLCISTQVGCALNCDFCATGKLGFKRNLTVAEIIGQLWLATKELSGKEIAKKRTITNVVLMGMGEPLLNFDNVLKALDLMLDDLAYGLSKYRVTVSTAGIVPEMMRMRDLSEVALAVSLHAANDELRSKIMPINDKYPLKMLIEVCKEYYKNAPKRVVTMEYIMLAEINDSIDDARQLVQLLRDVPTKINLILFNPSPNASKVKYKASTQTQIDAFRAILLAASFNAITRKSRGADIFAACGQLNRSAISID